MANRQRDDVKRIKGHKESEKERKRDEERNALKKRKDITEIKKEETERQKG